MLESAVDFVVCGPDFFGIRFPIATAVFFGRVFCLGTESFGVLCWLRRS